MWTVRVPSTPLGPGKADATCGYYSRQYFDCAARTAAMAARERAVAPGSGPEDPEDPADGVDAGGPESARTATVDSRQALSALSS